MPPGQGASGTVEDQLPLPVAVMSALRALHDQAIKTASKIAQQPVPPFFRFVRELLEVGITNIRIEKTKPQTSGVLQQQQQNCFS